jgi:4-amino-4-deoxy-L-arabinose transferase-like glycosyltransferase
MTSMLAAAARGLLRFAQTHPYLAVLLVLAVQTVPTLEARLFWYSDEVRHADVLQNLLEHGDWLILRLEGAMYPDKPPIYFWFLAGLAKLTGGMRELVPFLGAAISGVLFCWSGVWLARTTLGRQAPAVGLFVFVLPTCFYFLAITHYARMDLMFAAVIVASQTLLYQGFSAAGFSRRMAGGLGLTGVAALVKGPLGVAFPLLGLVLLALWRGRPGRLFRLDVLAGAVGAAALVGLWIGGIWLTADTEFEAQAYFDAVFGQQIVDRAVDAWHHARPWHYYFYTLPLVFLPWTLLWLCAPIRRALSVDAWSEALSRRRDENGIHYLGLLVLGGFALLSSIGTKLDVYTLPLLPPLAILTARLLGGMAERRRERFWTALAVLFLLLAIGLPFGELFAPASLEIEGIAFSTLLLGLTAWAVLRIPARESRLRLVALLLGLTLWVYPAMWLTARSLSDLMSPAEQARLIGDLARSQERTPVYYRTYPGVYAYYAGVDGVNTEDLDFVERLIDADEPIVLVVATRRLHHFGDFEARFEIVDQRRIIEQVYVVAVPK